MPIFSKPKSASLNPDKLANKKVYESDKARANSGTPSASSKVDAETFTSLTDTLEEIRNEMIKIQNSFDTFQIRNKFEYGNILNMFSKAIKQTRSINSNSITTTELIKLQDATNDLNAFYEQIDGLQELLNTGLNDLDEIAGDIGLAEYNKRKAFANSALTFYGNIVRPFKTLLTLLNTKLVASGNDANSKVPPELSGINAPNLQGAGFSTYKLEKGAIQYQNQKYI